MTLMRSLIFDRHTHGTESTLTGLLDSVASHTHIAQWSPRGPPPFSPSHMHQCARRARDPSPLPIIRGQLCCCTVLQQRLPTKSLVISRAHGLKHIYMIESLSLSLHRFLSPQLSPPFSLSIALSLSLHRSLPSGMYFGPAPPPPTMLYASRTPLVTATLRPNSEL